MCGQIYWCSTVCVFVWVCVLACGEENSTRLNMLIENNHSRQNSGVITMPPCKDTLIYIFSHGSCFPHSQSETTTATTTTMMTTTLAYRQTPTLTHKNTRIHTWVAIVARDLLSFSYYAARVYHICNICFMPMQVRSGLDSFSNVVFVSVCGIQIMHILCTRINHEHIFHMFVCLDELLEYCWTYTINHDKIVFSKWYVA